MHFKTLFCIRNVVLQKQIIPAKKSSQKNELGLIYKVEINGENKVNVEMTLTSPNCPVAESLPNSVKENIMKVEGVTDVDLKLVWDPPWNKDKMSEAAKLELNL